MTLLLVLMFLSVALTGCAIVAVFDLIERTTSKQGFPPSVFHRGEP